MAASDETTPRVEVPANARPDGTTVPGGSRTDDPPATRVRSTDTDPNETLIKPAGATTVLLPGAPAIPGYELRHEIARGGMGVVYAAVDAAFRREVAVKVMLPGMSAAAFVREAGITARLPHPGIPPVHAMGELPDGRPFLAMKLIKGDTLDRLLKSRQSETADRPRLVAAFEAMCQAVGYAHAQGIIHRDLKPANVMVGAFGEVQVMDWGLAKEVFSSTPYVPSDDDPLAASRRRAFATIDATQAGAIKGTPSYMAPEQARGEAVDARADVFALGGILTAILTGKPPFAGNSVMDTVIRAAEADLRDTFDRLDATDADADLIGLAKRCLAARADDRPADGVAVAKAVSAYRAEVEERLRRAERERAAAEVRSVEHRRQRRQQLVAIGVMSLVMAAVFSGQQWYELREERRESARELAAARAEGDRRAAEARLVGERDAEARNKAEQARQGIDANLKLSADLRKQYKFKEADAALTQAAELAKGGAPERVGVVEQARRDLAFVVKLDDIRYRKWLWWPQEGGKGGFDTTIAPPAYHTAFAEFGLDLTGLETTDAATRIATSRAKAEIVAALDDWALHEPDAVLELQLLDVARHADPGAWTDRFRDPKVRANRAAFEKLVIDADAQRLPPAVVSVLAEGMKQYGLNPQSLLTSARAVRPDEFELAFSLGRWHARNHGKGRQVGAYEAARALRPDNTTVLYNLGNALCAADDLDGAAAVYRRATELDPEFAPAHYRLGLTLSEKGDPVGALEAFRRAVDFDPKRADAQYELGVALHAKGDEAGAVAAWRRAVELDPKNARARGNLGAVYFQQREYVECIACARGAIAADANYSNAHALLGLALQRTGDHPGARAALTEAARIDPERWGPELAMLPPRPIAPLPREARLRIFRP